MLTAASTEHKLTDSSYVLFMAMQSVIDQVDLMPRTHQIDGYDVKKSFNIIHVAGNDDFC